MKNGYDQFFKKAQKLSAQRRPQSDRHNLEDLVKKKYDELHSGKEKKSALRTNPAKLSPTKSKKKNTINWKLTGFSFLGTLVALAGVLEFDRIEKYVQKIEINFMGLANAEEAAPNKAATEPVAGAEDKKAEPKPDWDTADAEHLSKFIERKKALDQREEEIARQEAEIATQKAELEKRIVELEKVRAGISKILEDRVKRDDERIDNLVQVYSNMKASQAARVLETLEKDLAVEVLGRMKKKNAADILNAMKPEVTQSISEMYAGYKRIGN